jgi:hypothetical protein
MMVESKAMLAPAGGGSALPRWAVAYVTAWQSVPFASGGWALSR